MGSPELVGFKGLESTSANIKVPKVLYNILYIYIYIYIYTWDSVQQNHPSGQFFKVLNFLIFRELQRASIKWSLRIRNLTIHAL